MRLEEFENERLLSGLDLPNNTEGRRAQAELNRVAGYWRWDGGGVNTSEMKKVQADVDRVAEDWRGKGRREREREREAERDREVERQREAWGG